MLAALGVIFLALIGAVIAVPVLFFLYMWLEKMHD